MPHFKFSVVDYDFYPRRFTEENGSGDADPGQPSPPPFPPSHRGESDTLELRITVCKSILFYSTIDILCRLAALAGKGMTTNENQKQ